MEYQMNDEKSCSRRGFLNSLNSIIGGTTVLAVTSPSIQAEQKLEIPQKNELLPVAKGYQRTEHVDTYYSLADL